MYLGTTDQEWIDEAEEWLDENGMMPLLLRLNANKGEFFHLYGIEVPGTVEVGPRHQ